MNAYRRSRGTTPLILNLGIRWRGAVNTTLWSLHPRKKRQYPLNIRRGGPQSCSERFGKEKKYKVVQI
jgi:hypothetical protein